jgi:bis(5'-nucleosyl)-tetraphosphatase (symmetrical)
MARRIFIGDIQGCREELELLLDRVRFDPSTDVLEPAGDLVNRGPDSLGTLRLLRRLGAGGVLGNHDLHLLRAARAGRSHRRGDTFTDVLAAPEAESLLDWLAARPLCKSWDDVLLVHAGVAPHWQDPQARLEGRDPLVADEDVDFATRARYCDAEGQRPARDDPPLSAEFRPWFEWPRTPRLADKTLVFGHWAMRGLLVAPQLRGLDSGCVWGGELSAWIAEEDRVVSVPARRAYASIGD